MEENHSYGQVIGPAAYQTQLAGRCGLAANYYGVTYPSLPNYIALTSGVIPSSIAGRDCLPVSPCLSNTPSIFSQAASWKVYAESMPGNCSRANSANGLYVPRHTAAPYYMKLSRCAAFDVPLGTTTSGALHSDLAAGTLAAFTLIVPNTADDGHNGCESCADSWLSRWIPQIVTSPAYQNGSTAVFITYDTDANNANNHVATIVVAPSVRAATVSQTAYTHYSLLHTFERLLGLTDYLGAASSIAGMATAFHLQ